MLACKNAVLETRWPRVRKEADPVSTSGCATIALASRHVVCDPPTAAAPLSAPQFGPSDFESWMRKEALRDARARLKPDSGSRRNFLYASIKVLGIVRTVSP